MIRLWVLDKIILIFIACIIAFSSQVDACNVPVFRYALERWPADTYDVIVFYRDALSPDDSAVVEWLENSSKKAIHYSNYTVQTFDVTAQMPEPVFELWKALGETEMPCMTVLYPGFFRLKYPVWTGRLSEKTAHNLVDSPLRQKIARQILDGESAVWILLESGDSKRDNAAASLLESQLKEAAEVLKLPDMDSSAVDYVPIRETGPELRVSFSMVRLSRKDPAESMFVRMLMKTEPDLDEYDSHPMAFPVYGRGRVLFALVGDGIEERNILEACSFITGPCSCQIKGLNPGIDLLIKVDWDTGFGEFTVQYMELPPLVGFSELVSDAKVADGSVKDEETSDEAGIYIKKKPSDQDSAAHGTADANSTISAVESSAEVGTDVDAPAVQPVSASQVENSSGHLLRNMLVVLGIIAVAAVLLSLIVLKTRRKDFI